MSERLAQLQKLHEAEPDDAFVTYGMAMEHAKAGSHESALHWLEQTLARDAEYLYAWFQKGKILHELGRLEEARQALELGITKARQAGDDKALGELSELLEAL